MDKDRLEGKTKDIAGRIQRQAGEWTGDEESEIKGAGKQVEGKVQNIAGKAKDALRRPRRTDDESEQEQSEIEEESESQPRRRRA
jgi:uncharacterized protein YjbJ (UPF0337 family)